MATSTADLIRADLVAAIEGIAESQLGFDDDSEAVNSYLLEEEVGEKTTDFLFATVDSEQVARKWAVQVYESERFAGVGSTKETGFRDYEIVIEGYYGGYGSSPNNLMLTHERYVRKACKDLGLNLSGRVSALLNMPQGSTRIETIADVGIELFVRRLEWQAERYNPDWT